MEKRIDEKQSLAIISEMIDNAREKIADDGFFYLLWGYLVLSAALTHFILLDIVGYENAWMPWPILMTLGGIVSAIAGHRKARSARHKTFFDTAAMYLWSAFLIALFMILAFAGLGKIGQNAAYPLIMVIYGLGTWVSGGILKFLPLIIGGVICWILAGIAFYYPFEIQLLLLALSILLAYIIPGHMLKIKASRHV